MERVERQWRHRKRILRADFAGEVQPSPAGAAGSVESLVEPDFTRRKRLDFGCFDD
jgi:hypothetical protein